MIKKKRVAAICKSRRHLAMQTTRDKTQWIGDGQAMYILAGIEPMSAEGVASMLDYTENDVDSINFTDLHAPETIYADSGADVQIDDAPTRVIIKRAEYLIFQTGDRLIFIDEKYLTPIVTDKQTTYHIRSFPDGTYILCVKKGLLLEAIILGEQLESDLLHDWANEMGLLFGAIQSKYIARRIAEDQYCEQLEFEEET